MKKVMNRKGFTLIEIIAVLIILGILAAVAIPKFLDLQRQSRTASLETLVAAAQSNTAMKFSANLLDQDGSVEAASAATTAADCADVTRDGWLSEATLSCTKGTDAFVITASHASADQDATGRFTKPQ